jgi:hypothetical protein
VFTWYSRGAIAFTSIKFWEEECVEIYLHAYSLYAFKACWLCPVTTLSSSVWSSFVSTLFPWNILCLLNVYYCYSFQRNLHFPYKVALIHTHTYECFILFVPSCKGSRVNSCSYTVLLLHFVWYCKYVLVLKWDFSMSLHHYSISV